MSDNATVIRRMFDEIINQGKLDLVDELFDPEFRTETPHDGDFMGIPATGRTIDFDSLNVATFRDGRGLRHKVVMDTAKMLMQLGVVPAPA